MIAEKFLMGLVRGKRLALFNTLHGFFIKKQRLHSLSLLICTCRRCSLAAFPRWCAVRYFLSKTRGQASLGCQREVAVAASQHHSPDLAPHLPAPIKRDRRLSRSTCLCLLALGFGVQRCWIAHGLVSLWVMHDTEPLESPQRRLGSPSSLGDATSAFIFWQFKNFLFIQLCYLPLLHLRNSHSGQICLKK